MSVATLDRGLRKPPAERRAEFRRAAERTGLAVVPVVVTLLRLAQLFKANAVAVDFHASYYPAAERLLDGANPYAVTHHDIVAGTAFVYPALSALVFAPFALIDRGPAQVIYTLLCIACVPAILRTLNVRDWRVYGISLLWLPVFSGWQTANVTLPLTLLAALAWRHRDRPLAAGLITAVAISIKPFIWPLALWLLATRRFSAAAWMLACGLAVNLLAWWLVGFDQIGTYMRLSGQVTDALWRGGYSMLAVAHQLGFGRGVGEALLLAVSILVGLAVLYLGLVRCDERRALTAAVALMLVASPLVWSHYFALLLIPLALYRPRLAPIWVVPVLMWPMPPSTAAVGWQVALAWVLATVCVCSSLAPARPRPGHMTKHATMLGLHAGS